MLAATVNSGRDAVRCKGPAGHPPPNHLNSVPPGPPPPPAPPQVVVRNERLCHDCLAAQLQAKVHGAIKLRGLIGVGDTVALAFSGGAASAALLHFLAALRNPRTDRLARGKASAC